MNNTQQQKQINSTIQNKPKKLGPCCVCKQTKKLRDQCLFEKDQEQCMDFINLHNVCLKQHGFQPAKLA